MYKLTIWKWNFHLTRCMMYDKLTFRVHNLFDNPILNNKIVVDKVAEVW